MPTRRAVHRSRWSWIGVLLLAGAAACAAGSWQSTPPMSTGRWAPCAAAVVIPALPPATPVVNVLVAGGYDGLTTTSTADLYDLTAGAFIPTGPMLVGRNFATTTVLDNGKVLVAGGFNDAAGSLREAELYDPALGAFRPTLGLMTAGRELFTATKLPNGKVLLTGGLNANSNSTIRSAELYDPVTETFTAIGTMQSPFGRFGHDAVLLGGLNKVLIVGGKEHRSGSDWRAMDNGEVYDIATGSFTLTKSMANRREPSHRGLDCRCGQGAGDRRQERGAGVSIDGRPTQRVVRSGDQLVQHRAFAGGRPDGARAGGAGGRQHPGRGRLERLPEPDHSDG